MSKRVQSITVQNRPRGETEAAAGTSHHAPDQMVVRDKEKKTLALKGKGRKGCGNVKLKMYRWRERQEDVEKEKETTMRDPDQEGK